VKNELSAVDPPVRSAPNGTSAIFAIAS